MAGNRITLNWLAPTTGGQITEYVVRAGTAPGAYNLFNGSVGAGTSVTETVASGTYHISVAARNATGVGPDSTEITVVVGVAVPVPGAPRSVTGSASGNTITVNWQAPLTGAPITNYVVRAGNTAPGAYNLYNGSVGPQTSISETVANGTYFVSVAAQNATGVGPASTEIRVTVGPTTPLRIVGRIYWNTTPVSGAHAQLKAGDYYTTPVLAEATTAADGSFTINNPPSGNYWIYAVSPGTEYWEFSGSLRSIPASGTTDVGIMYLSKKLQLLQPPNGATITSTTPTLEWRAFPEATRYHVDVFNDAPPRQAVLRQDTAATSLTVPQPLARGVRYQWSVIAYSAAGTQIAYWSVWGFTVQ